MIAEVFGMFNKNAKWITNGEFCLLEPQNVFHKELDDIKLSHDKAPKNRHILFRKKVEPSSKKGRFVIVATV